MYFAGDPYLAPNDCCGASCHSDSLLLRVEPSCNAANIACSGVFNIFLEAAPGVKP